MNIKYNLYLLSFISEIFAAKFSVVSFSASCKLSINGETYSMEPHPKCANLFGIEVDVSLNTKYKYICDGKEDVERILKEKTTHNELFGRALTVYDMPEFYYPDSKEWSRSIGRTELFDPSYVPIVIIDTDKQFFVNPKGGSNFRKVTFILKDNVFSFYNVKKSTKNYDEDKFQIKINLKDENIYKRSVFKFRPSAYDPAFFRQILYGDIAHAIGNPTHESVSVRLYHADGTGIGLYVLQEDISTESFIKTSFYGRPDGSIKDYHITPIYDCSTGADFNPDDPNELGAFQNLLDEYDNKIELKEMFTKIAQVDIKDEKQIKDIDENWLDLDTLFKALALEYLAGHWDSYWFLTSNFVTYHPYEETEGTLYNYSKYKYYFIDQDFDQTWSIGMHQRFDPINFPRKSYTYYVGRNPSFWTDINYEDEADIGSRVIINRFIGCDNLKTCPTKVRFENHLKSIVKYIFNPYAIGKKVYGYKDRLDEEIKWDSSLVHLHKGTERLFDFNYESFVNGIEYGVSSYYGIMDWTKLMAENVCKEFKFKYVTTEIDNKKKSVNSNSPNQLSNVNSRNADINKFKASMTLTIFTIVISIIILL